MRQGCALVTNIRGINEISVRKRLYVRVIVKNDSVSIPGVTHWLTVADS